MPHKIILTIWTVSDLDFIDLEVCIDSIKGNQTKHS